MNKHLKLMCTVAFFALTVVAAVAQKATVTYVEGSSQIKAAAGSLREADFGSTVTYGEAVITGRDGQVELRLENGSTIKLAANSVFNYSSTGTGTNTRPVLATTAGRITYKIAKATGQGPVIQTNSAVAGVRGTEFTIFAGRDGATMLAVIEGVVDIEAEGKMVTLYKDEAVDVEAGKAPGEKVIWIGRELDFSSWNTGRMDAFFADPVGTVESLNVRLAGYQRELAALLAGYEAITLKWQEASSGYRSIVAAGDKDAIRAYQQNVLFPAEDMRAATILNMRYWALNYLSARRYVLSNMYMELKSRYPLVQPPEIQEFFARHRALIEIYEQAIVPELNNNDY